MAPEVSHHHGSAAWPSGWREENRRLHAYRRKCFHRHRRCIRSGRGHCAHDRRRRRQAGAGRPEQETGSALAHELGGIFVRCDVSSEDDAQAVVQAAQALGSLRGLINCAGIAPAEKLIGKNGPHTMALFMKTLNINLVGSFNMARFAADAMAKGEALAEGERGIIIHTASVAAYDGQIGQTAYSASRAPSWR
jgi:NAD(P)-dependent dehydrogenase (short-subunit alcohol dehydrogenase family)